MPTLRLFKASLQSTAPTLRLFRAALTGTAQPKLRVYQVGVTGSVAVGLAPIADRTLEPMDICSTTATPVAGSPTPDTYTWRQVSGPSVTLSGSGATRTFAVPSVLPPNPGQVVLGVTGSASGVPGREVLFTVNFPPQTRWTWNGTAWIGGGRVPL